MLELNKLTEMKVGINIERAFTGTQCTLKLTGLYLFITALNRFMKTTNIKYSDEMSEGIYESEI